MKNITDAVTTINNSDAVTTLAAAIKAAPTQPTKLYRSTLQYFAGRTWTAIGPCSVTEQIRAEIERLAPSYDSFDGPRVTYAAGRPSNEFIAANLMDEFRASLIECRGGISATVSRKSLQTALEILIKATDKKTIMPVLSHVLIMAGPEGMKIAATDLYLAAHTTLFCTSTRIGSVCLPAKDLLDRVKASKAGDVTISQDVDGVGATSITMGTTKFSLNGLPGETFPVIPTLEEWPDAYWEHTESAAEFLADWEHCGKSICTDITRTHLNSLLIEDCGRARLRMVSTDGHRLALAGSAEPDATQTLLVPLQGIQAIVHALKKSKAGAITFARDAGETKTAVTKRSGNHTSVQWLQNVFVTIGAYTVIVKLVDAQFPAYRQVIPSSGDQILTMDAQELAATLKRVSVASSERTGGVKFTQSAIGSLNISAESTERGKCEETIACEGALHLAPEKRYRSSDKPLAPTDAFGLNAKYLMDAIGKTTARICLRLSAAIDPIVVTAEGDADRLTVVMPMRI